MSNKRFWWSVAAVWLVMFLTDWVLHGMWMSSWYMQTMQFWRPEEEMKGMMPYMWLGRLIFSWAFVWIYSNGVSKDNQWWQAFRYALAILLVSAFPWRIEMWVTSPYPTEMVLRWGVIATVQAILCSFAMTWTFKPLEWWKKAHENA